MKTTELVDHDLVFSKIRAAVRTTVRVADGVGMTQIWAAGGAYTIELLFLPSATEEAAKGTVERVQKAVAEFPGARVLLLRMATTGGVVAP